ncbi:hypothetical protein A4D02_24700 [Niastella koreensis]|uniref:DUF3108 domain-containing protein n=2 Tax=Niastella koreensis TaxID=354356 RepID=G8TEU7_NIAKG|nr:hypothetical protein [Niastella koreensis]AEW00533.1 hypothetical protein Niako_4262 [Niastella koreensis GR20-10]OQP52391.1 hypothetical protein A4D02_24700 [Niastella koreensis]
MKYTLTLLLAVAALFGHSQTIQVPGGHTFDKKYLKNGSYDMTLFMEREGKMEEAFLFTFSVTYTGKILSVYTSMVMLADTTSRSTDTSISDGNTFKPIYRSSNSAFHKMVLNYGKNVSGYYYNKESKKKYFIKEQGSAFFDNYAYPYLLALLPFTTGYTTEMAIFDFKPENSRNIKTAHINEVTSEVYVSEHSGEHKVWRVNVYEDVPANNFVYYFDQETRRIWKIDFEMHDTHMVFIAKEG